MVSGRRAFGIDVAVERGAFHGYMRCLHRDGPEAGRGFGEAVRRTPPRWPVVTFSGRAEVTRASHDRAAADIEELVAVEGFRPLCPNRHRGLRLHPCHEGSGGTGSAVKHPAASFIGVVHGNGRFGTCDRGNVREGATGAFGIALPRRLPLEFTASGAGAVPCRLRPAAGVFRFPEGGSANGDDAA